MVKTVDYNYEYYIDYLHTIVQSIHSILDQFISRQIMAHYTSLIISLMHLQFRNLQ